MAATTIVIASIPTMFFLFIFESPQTLYYKNPFIRNRRSNVYFKSTLFINIQEKY
jgi:hypothetical protein